MKSVRFKNAHLTIAANLYLPAAFNETVQYPAIVFVHPSGGVKEQTAGLYAQRLAEHGFVTLAFDASYQGESEGAPRHLENPYQRVEDISAAIDYLTTLAFINAAQIGVVGICAGGGYATHATMQDKRIRALGTISSVNYGDMYRSGWDGTLTPEQSFSVLQLAAEQRSHEAAGAGVAYLPTTPASAEEAANKDFAEAYEYYRTERAMHPNAPSKLTTRSLMQLVTYDAFNHAEIYLTQPLCVIAGSEAGTLWMSEQIIKRAASKQKQLHIVAGATHIGLYDRTEYVTEAVAQLAPFFKNHL
ncbi:alpha/beta hydrolase [Rheinheimera sp. NSM]|uniref:alpha/beta hydrolase n=1 Tax=Rheinheimera sp. NSM TaxID=3457884 RepID=UPI0040358598